MRFKPGTFYHSLLATTVHRFAKRLTCYHAQHVYLGLGVIPSSGSLVGFSSSTSHWFPPELYKSTPPLLVCQLFSLLACSKQMLYPWQRGKQTIPIKAERMKWISIEGLFCSDFQGLKSPVGPSFMSLVKTLSISHSRPSSISGGAVCKCSSTISTVKVERRLSLHPRERCHSHVYFAREKVPYPKNLCLRGLMACVNLPFHCILPCLHIQRHKYTLFLGCLPCVRNLAKQLFAEWKMESDMYFCRGSSCWFRYILGPLLL